MAAQPPFYLQISDDAGTVVRTRAGGKHEADLIDLFVDAIVDRGVGFFKTKAQVTEAIKAGIKAAIHSIKVKDPSDTVD